MTSTDDLQAFLLILRRALLMVVRWIEKNYQVDDTHVVSEE